MNAALEVAVEAVRDLIFIIEEAIKNSASESDLITELRAQQEKFSLAIGSLEKVLELQDKKADQDLTARFDVPK